jgi:two-component system sensor histidine kinase SenX3
VIIVGGDVGGKVLGSESQLVTALANLLENAIAYSEENTRVALAARQREETWEITVTDQGIGIPAEDLDRVFERFYRVDPARSRETGGTGLGLAIVKNIVNNHGGHVRVWSSPGSGSTFTLELPAADTTRLQPAPKVER